MGIRLYLCRDVSGEQGQCGQMGMDCMALMGEHAHFSIMLMRPLILVGASQFSFSVTEPALSQLVAKCVKPRTG